MSSLNRSIVLSIAKLMNHCPLKWYYALSYIHNRKRIPNFKNPKDLSEIWISYLLSGKVHEHYWLADKYEVRKYICERIGEEYLTPLIGVYLSPEEINWDSLPQRFAIKMNYGAGMNLICSDKSKLDVIAAKETLQLWSTRSQNYSKSESHYNLIKHRIIAEEFIDDGNGGFPTDYKFMCLNGKVEAILAVNGRECGHGSYLPYSVDWTPRYDYSKNGNVAPIEKPKNLEEMITVAEKLATGIELVRVDLYSNGTKIWFGEMTLTPAGCIFHRWTQKAIDELGLKYSISKK